MLALIVVSAMVGLATDHYSSAPYAAAVGLSQTISGGCARVCLRGIMSNYGTKKALVDLGFVDGYFYSRPCNIDDEGFHDNLMDAFERIEKTVVEGTLLTASPSEAEYRKLLRDLGFVRGWAWQKKIPDAVSEAVTRVIDYFSESLPVDEIVFARPKDMEPHEKMVSDDDRHEIKDWYKKYPHVNGISNASGMDEDVVARIVEPVRDQEAEAKIEAELQNEFEIEPEISSKIDQEPLESLEASESKTLTTTASRSKGWSPEARAAAAERLRARRAAGLMTRRKAEKPKLADQIMTRIEHEQPDDRAVITASPVRLDFDPLSESDWPEVQKLIVAGKSREAIAGDFDVPVEHLKEFVDAQLEAGRLRRLSKEFSPGEALAPQTAH